MNARQLELKTKNNKAIEAIFQWVLKSSAPFVLVKSPPGGGKSTLLNTLGIYIALETLINSEFNSRPPRLIMITQSHAQAISLVRGLLRKSKNLPLHIVGSAGADKVWPDEISKDKSFTQLDKGEAGVDFLLTLSGQLDTTAKPFILVTNSSKAQDIAQRHDILDQYFDYGFVDEAFQMRYADFLFTMGLAKRWIPVGDPGQLNPVNSEPSYDLAYVEFGARPYLPMPLGLIEEGIEVQQLTLPISWRLPQDTVEIIQPAFYKDLMFEGAGEPANRKLTLSPGKYFDGLDRALDAISNGLSLQMVTLPAQPPNTENDVELHRQAVEVIKRLLERNATILDLDSDTKVERPVTSKDILVLASKVSQVADLQAQIQQIKHKIPLKAEIVATEQIQSCFDSLNELSKFTDEQELLQTMINHMEDSDDSTLVDTANRLQGLESPIVIALHPCSGLEHLSDFDLEIGRLCVMLSRHRIGCVLLSRANVRELLFKPYLSNDRALENDPAESVHSGLVAHRRLLDELAKRGRVW